MERSLIAKKMYLLRGRHDSAYRGQHRRPFANHSVVTTGQVNSASRDHRSLLVERRRVFTYHRPATEDRNIGTTN